MPPRDAPRGFDEFKVIQAFLEQFPEGVMILDDDHRVRFVNQAATAIFGSELRRVLGDTFRFPIAKKGRLELEIPLQDGKSMSLELARMETRWDGEKCILVVVRDISERKRAERELLLKEEQLRQSQKMEAVGRLAGGVAHDFNNLLMAISGYSDFLLEQLREDAPMRSEVEEIRKAGQKAAALTRQLLAFSRKQVLKPEVININHIVTDLRKMLDRVIGEDIELIATLDPRAGRVRVDPGQIEQVLMNLVVNARDAMPKGGKLVIETKNVTLDQDYASRHMPLESGEYVMLAISDNGCGMNGETLRHVFEPFFTTKEKGKGTGLGLSTVYGIVKQSGGYIWMYSEVGLGTTCKIYFPNLEGVSQTSPAPAKTRPMPKGKETILIVEDEEVVRSLVRLVLEKNGYTVLTARNAQEATLILKHHEGPIHLVLTDVVMPQMGGRELVKRMQEVRPGAKVLYMSGYTDDAIVKHGILEPGAAFIQKPFTPATLSLKIREALDQESPDAPL